MHLKTLSTSSQLRKNKIHRIPFKERTLSNKIWLFVSYGLLLFWMVLIFSLSAQVAEASAQLSGGLLQKLLALLPFPISEFFLRKMAHFTEFLILGLFFYHAFYRSFLKRMPVISFLCTALYAVSDEVHQIFVPGRACQFRDMLIDSAGALLGILLISGILLCIHKKQSNQKFIK